MLSIERLDDITFVVRYWASGEANVGKPKTIAVFNEEKWAKAFVEYMNSDAEL